VIFGDDRKGKVLGTGIIMVNDHFTLNDVTLVDKLRYNLLPISQLIDANLDLLLHKSTLMFLILLAILFVAFLALEIFFKLISLLLSLL
jgi:hypothetical protein